MHNECNYIVRSGECLSLAGRTGRSDGRRNLSGIRRPGNSCGRRCSKRRHYRRYGYFGHRRTERKLYAGSGPASQIQLSLRRVVAAIWGKQLIHRFELDKGKDPQHYGIGIKELWDIPVNLHQQGLVVHTAGWPLSESGAMGGGFLYHMENNQVVVGLITDLNYSNPHLSPFDEFQRYKHNPVVKRFLEGGRRVSYGARAIAKGGLQSLPE